MGDPNQERLLEVQQLDIQADQLVRRRADLPARASRRQVGVSMAQVDEALGVCRAALAELRRTQGRLEDEAASLVVKVEAEDRRLYSGTVTSPRELEAIQGELASLRRHVVEIEDRVLEVMEQVEPLAAEEARLAGDRAALEADAGALDAAIAEAEVIIDDELGAVMARRAEVVDAVPTELLAQYDRLRPRLDGVAVARLEGDRCLGCHLSLPASELSRARRAPVDAVVHHEECGRILVR